MEDAIDDIYLEGEFYDALEDVLSDFVTLKAGILKGPVIRNRKRLEWAQENDPLRPNAVKPVLTDKAVRTYYAVSPFDLYLTPEARNCQEGTLIERHNMRREVLYNMIGMPGFNEQAIRDVMRDHGDGGLREWLWTDTERDSLENRSNSGMDSGGNIDVLEFWTKVRGKWLKEWGAKGVQDEDRWYEANCWLIGNHVVRAVLIDDPLQQRPYHMDSYVRVRNSPWGRGVPEIMEDLQNMCDACARAIANNMGIASGPQAEVNIDQLPEGESITKMYPWKIWQTTSAKTGGTGGAVHWFQPNSNADVLMAVFQFFSNLADEYTGIPKYQYGDPNVGGAGRTASGLSMLMNAASKTMKGVVKNIDKIIISCTKLTHRSLMLYDSKIDNKGDVQVVAKASQALLHRESQSMLLGETLAATNNPIDFQIMGPTGRLELMRGALRGMDAIDVDKVLPSDDQMLLQAFAAGQQPPQEENNEQPAEGEM